MDLVFAAWQLGLVFGFECGFFALLVAGRAFVQGRMLVHKPVAFLLVRV